MLSTVSLKNASNATGSWQYLYDDNGNITRIITTVNDVCTTTYYHYDTAGQLVREDNQKAGTTTLWTYDNAGNILTEKVYAHTTGTPSTLRKTNTYTYTSTQWGDLLTAYNGNMIYYDGMTTLGSFKVGNPTTYNNGTAWTFTWEHGRQLATMTSGGTTWTNTYNSDGLRTSRTDGTTTYTYIYENGRLSAIKRNDLNMWIIYDDNGPVTLKYGSGTFHYVTNPQGDVVAIVGNQGQKLVEYTYDAWGKVTSITGDYAYNLGVHNPILYRGYIYDHETGLYYCQSRYYDPQTRRFLNADAFASTGQGLLGNNMFAYCGNNPVNYSDPTGELGLVGLGIIISGVIGGVVAAATTAASGGSVAEIIVSGLIGAGTASATAAVAASGLTLATVAWVSAGIGAAGEMLSQGTEYLFHKNDEDYEYDWVEGATKVLYSSGMNAIGGSVSKGINSVFASTDPGGTFVSGVASSGLGGLDFGIRQFISAIID